MKRESRKPIRVEAMLTRIATLELDQNVDFQQRQSTLIWNLLQQYNKVQADRGNRRRLLLEPLGGENGVPDEIAVYEMESALVEEDLDTTLKGKVLCRECGAENISGALYCMSCGARLPK